MITKDITKDVNRYAILKSLPASFFKNVIASGF